MSIVTRFAPSPTGFLHLGHAYSAFCSWAAARQAGGLFHLRLEDIDSTRCRPEFAEAITEDLQWLGLNWDGPVRMQSAHLPEYQSALAKLAARGLLYPCFCTRHDIATAQAAPHATEAIYPGTCRSLPPAETARRIAAGQSHALRLHTAQAMRGATNLRFFDADAGWIAAEPLRLGDIVLARKDIPSSYHLCVVHDDAVQNITHVIRGEDLREATHMHILLQHLLGLPVPAYQFHRLLTDTTGKRLAKRDHAATLRAMRAAGVQPAAIINQFTSAAA